jgi:diguanylate cyclase (GGDEF)-like protein
MDWIRSRHDLDDERVLIGVTAGLLWLVGACAAILAQLVPGAAEVDPVLFVAMTLAVLVYGAVSVSGWFDWSRVSVRGHAIATGTLTPLLGLVVWATGGQESYLMPLLVLPLLHIAYFFEWRVGVPLILELVTVAASPVLYEKVVPGSVSRLVTFASVAVVVTFVLRVLKGRLVAAEAHHRHMSLLDPLTGLVNRRGFDETLHAAVAARGEAAQGRRAADDDPGFALLVFDLDRFKLVNDTQGHPAGDRLLRTVAANCAAIVRPADTLARIGGDEFAVIAPGAGIGGAERLASELLVAVRRAGAEATVAWAVHPDDGSEGDALLRQADRRLYRGKAALART